MLPAGTIIDDKYKVLRAIGSGGFGAVYVASQTQLDRAVAVKMLNTTLLQESDGFARFEREAKAICTIKHKNVVSIYGFGSWQGAPYMVMELLPGVSLQTILESSTLPPLRAVAIMKQVFEGLGAAHSAGIVHRDLKPSNIMILDTPEHKDLVKIIDFGLVKLMPGHGEEGQKLTETGYALGTCSYMAPEQALGGRIDHRVDIYSAGCIFFQCLSGKPPFVADDDVAVMYQHINQRAEPVEALIQDGPLVAAAAAVIDNCMEKQPETRYQSCTEVISALESIERGEYAKLQRFTSRKRKVIATPKLRPMVAVVSAGVVLGAAIGFLFIQKQDEQTSALSPQERYRQHYIQAAEHIEVAQKESKRGRDFALAKLHSAEAWNLLTDPHVQLRADAYRPSQLMSWMLYTGEERKIRAYGDKLLAGAKAPSTEMHMAVLTNLAELKAVDGDLQTAERAAREGAKLSSGHGLSNFKALVALVNILCLTNRPEEAEEVLNTALNANYGKMPVLRRAFEAQSRIRMLQHRYLEARDAAKHSEDYPPVGDVSAASVVLRLAANAALNDKTKVQQLLPYTNHASLLAYRSRAMLEFDVHLAEEHLRKSEMLEELERLKRNQPLWQPIYKE